MHIRTSFVGRMFAAYAGCAFAMTGACVAQGYPSKPVRVVVGFGPGGGADTAARVVGPKLSEYLGQPIVVENRPGASTAIATERVAKSPPDGYTLLLLPSSTTILSAMRPKLPFDLLRDFAAVSMLVKGQFALVVHPSVPARDIKQLLALGRAQPGKLTYGSSGAGSASHLAAELFGQLAKMKVLHVPYKGANDATVATASGEIDMFFATIAPMLPLRTAGKIRALAVTGAERTALLPDMPTIAEAGLPGYERYVWYGLVAPAGVPEPVVGRLYEAIQKALAVSEMSVAYGRQGLEPGSMAPQKFGDFIRKDIETSRTLVTAAGIKAN